MFDNISERIKTLAKVTCFVGIILSCLYGIIGWYNAVNVTVSASKESQSIFLGFLYFILRVGLGSLLSLIGSYFLYGLGDLIQSNNNIEYYCEQIKNKLCGEDINSEDIYESETDVESNEGWICPKCGEPQKPNSIYCKKCGKIKDPNMEENN